jgi:hypothetical protein
MSGIRRIVLQVFLSFGALALFWIACVSTVRWHEMIVGIGAVAVSMCFCLFVIRTLPLRFEPSLGSIVQLWRLPWYIVGDSFQIVGVLARDVFGSQSAPSLFRSARYRCVTESGFDTAQRTLAIGYTNVSPNFIIVGIDRQHGQMLFHQLEKSEIPVMTRRLGAEGGH